jgi:hypothetical protein
MKLLILISFLLVGCATVPVRDVKTFPNEATMPFSVDGVNYVGMAAVPRKTKQIIKYSLPKTAERIVISSCHGAPTALNPSNPYVFEYYPVHLIEDVGLCLLKAEVASKESPLSLAVIDFYGEDVTMPAWVTCNRISLRVGGGSVCQAPAGLIQRITFDEAVLAEPLDGSNKIECDGGNCIYTMTKGYGGYIFRGIKTGKDHRHTIRGTTATEN